MSGGKVCNGWPCGIGRIAGTANLAAGGNCDWRGVKLYRGPGVGGLLGLVIIISGTAVVALLASPSLLEHSYSLPEEDEWSNVEGRGVLNDREWLVYGLAMTSSPLVMVDSAT